MSKLDILEGRSKPGTLGYKIDSVTIVVAYVAAALFVLFTTFNLLMDNGDPDGYAYALLCWFAALLIRRERRITELEDENG